MKNQKVIVKLIFLRKKVERLKRTKALRMKKTVAGRIRKKIHLLIRQDFPDPLALAHIMGQTKAVRLRIKTLVLILLFTVIAQALPMLII
ncbi:hypothetical protein DYH10_04060 [Candidatus Saccharibacteria bacterium CPR2]|nr:hypothetical protein [Candidatus Saccharibacteria bacterium CPR2]